MNEGHLYEEFVPPEAAGLTAPEWLARSRPHTDAREWARRAAAGLVTVDGRPPSGALRPGQRLSWRRPPWEEPPAPLSFAVLAEDDDLLAVAKPSGLPTLPGAGFLENTLQSLVRRSRPGARAAHRLGRGTSGVVLFTKNAAAARAVGAAWAAGAVRKVYRALVSGAPPASFRVDAPIGPVPHPRLGTVHAADPAGRPALSTARVLDRRDGAALVEVVIATGRPHQIRVHMAAAGHPLVADPLYAPGGSPRPDAVPGDLGYHLHALRLELPHPGGGTFSAEAPPPSNLAAPFDIVSPSEHP